MFVLALLLTVLLPSMTGAEDCYCSFSTDFNCRMRVLDDRLFFSDKLMDATFDFKRKRWLGTPVDPSQESFSKVIVDGVQNTVITWFNNGTCGYFVYDGPFLQACVPTSLKRIPFLGPVTRYTGPNQQYEIVTLRGQCYPSSINIGSKSWRFLKWGQGNHASHPNANLLDVCFSETNSYLSWTL